MPSQTQTSRIPNGPEGARGPVRAFAAMLCIAASGCYGGAGGTAGETDAATTGIGDGDTAAAAATGQDLDSSGAGGTVTGAQGSESGDDPDMPKYPEPYPEPACPAESTTDDLDDYLTRWIHCHTSARTERLSAIDSAEEVYERQAYVRGRMLAEIGDFPERTPLNTTVVATHERDGYRIENIIYESQPGFFVTANLYVPTTGPGPFPAVLSVAGHGPTGKKGAPRYSANTFANRGFVVLAYDPPGQGERVDISNPHFTVEEHGNGVAEHSYYGVLAELTGENFARHEVWDGIRGIDYLYSRPEVDQSTGVGILGCSGGGTQSAFMAAFDERVSAAVAACYMTRWPEYDGLWLDGEQAWRDFLRDGLNYSDYPLAMAPQPGASPRAFKMLQGVNDYFPIEGARATAIEAELFYSLIGEEEQFDFFEFACPPDDPECGDGHGWVGPFLSLAYDWNEQWLRGAPADVISENGSDFTDLLGCTSTGQVMTAPELVEWCDEQGIPGTCPKSVQTLSMERAEQLARAIDGAADAAEARDIVATRIRVGARDGVPPVVQTDESANGDYLEERLSIETEEGFTVPAVLFVPLPDASNRAAVLYIDRIDDASLEDAQEIVETGRVVLLVEPRGSDLAAHRLVRGVHVGTNYTQSNLASLVGKPLVGRRVTDALRAFDYLITRTEVDPTQVSVFGRDKGGITALHVGVLEPSIVAIAAEDTLLSYMNFVQTKDHHGFNDLVIPGVLQDYDLPDLASAASPRLVWISSPRRADTPLAQPSPDAEPASEGTPATLAEAEAAYAPAGTPSSVHVLLRASGSSFMQTYGDWLE